MELNTQGYILPKKRVDKAHEALILKDLKVTPHITGDFGQRPKPFKIYTDDDDNYYVPRYWGIKYFGLPQKVSFEQPTTSMDITFRGELRPYQQEIIDKLDNVFYKDTKLKEYGGGIVCIPPGGGKTVIAINYACKLNMKTLIVVHKTFLLDQWVERLQQYTDASIGIIRQDKVQVDRKEVVIAMLQTLLSRDYNDLLKQFPVVIFDECFPYSQHILTHRGTMSMGKIYDMWNNKEELPLVHSYNEETHMFEWKKITYAWKKPYSEKLVKITWHHNNSLSCTPNHKLLTVFHDWKEARELQIGDLLRQNCEASIITSIEWIDVDDKYVYDIEVADNHNFVCCMENSTSGVIAHNCHHLGAESFSQVMNKTRSPYIIGLTATPERTDKLEKVFYWNIGELLHRGEKKKESRKAIVKMFYFRCQHPKFKTEVNKWNQKVNMPKMITNITEIEERNELIVNTIKDTLEAEPERKIFLLTNRRAHIDEMQKRLKQIYPDDVGLYIGGMKKDKLKESEEKTIILGTYEMASEGLDIPDLDTLILATPKSDIVQSIGRIMRKEEADYINVPLIVDIVDTLDVFYGMSHKRKRIYNQNKYEIQVCQPGQPPEKQASSSESESPTGVDMFDD
jgi:superfamily II DNA or RNA helicase